MTTINGIYRVKNDEGNYDVIHLETNASQVIDNPDRRFTTDIEKSSWNNKANQSGSLNVDFNTKNLTINGNITPNTNGTLNIGADNRKINQVIANATKVDAVHIGSTSNALCSENGVITVKGNTNQDVAIKTTGTGSVKINTAGNLNLTANGSNSILSVQANKSVDVTSSNINLNGSLATKNTSVSGTLSVSGDATLKGETNVESNYLTINSKETGSGVTSKLAGMKVKRGTAADFLLIFDESDDKVKAGPVDSLESIATEQWVKDNSTNYVHPVSHPASMITESTSRRFVSDAEKTAWNNKEVKGHIHIGDDISDATSSNSANMIVKRNANGDFSARTITASLSGNASTATKLQTPRSINGIAFDGSKDITITAEPNIHNHEWNAITNKPVSYPPSTHNHDDAYLKISGGGLTGVLTLNALLQDNRLTTGNKQLMNVGSGNTIYVGNPSTNLILESVSNPSISVGGNSYKMYHSGNKQPVAWGDVTGKPTSFAPSSHNHNSGQVNALTGYTKATLTSALIATDTLNTALGKLERALDDKSNNHTHPYRSNTWVPAWTDVTGKPSFSTVATSGSYNDLSNKPTIHTINDSSTTSTTNTWSAKKINDSLAGKSATGHKHVVADITDAGDASKRNVGTGSGNVPVLDSKGKLAVSTLPSIAINETFTASTIDDAMTKTVEVGDIMIVGSGSSTYCYICADVTKTTFDEKFKPLMSAADSVTKGEFNDAIASKVDKVNGKQLSTNDFTSAYKTKLDGIATNANNYVHPSKHAPAEISTDSNNRFVTDAEKTTWNGKAAGNHNHNSVYAPIDHSSTHDTRYFRRDTSNAVDVRLASADGRGLRFWDSDAYKIYMSATANATYGGGLDTTGDYNMYFKMTGDNRGFVFKNDINVVAQIEGTGKLFTKNEIYVGDAKNRVYHAGNKPTPSDIGAAPTHSHPYLNTSGGSLTGAITLANNTWNKAGDDVLFGDCNQAGRLGIKGANGNSGLYFMPYSGSTAQSMTIDGAGVLTITGTTAGTFSGSLSGNASSATKLANIRTINGTNFDGTGNITTTKWGTARTITLTGGATGSVSIDGSANVSLATTVNWANVAGKPTSLPANGGNADTVDNLHANAFGRAYSNSYSFGGNNNAISTASFISILNNLGAFNQAYWIARGSWNYAGNQYINDTGCGNIHLAGCTVEVMGSASTYTIRIHTPTTSSSGVTHGDFIYVNNGNDYAPGWRRLYNTSYKPTAADVGALAVSGKAADSGKLNGVADSTSATANTIAKRDSAGDVVCRLVRSNYQNQSTISGAMAFRVSNSGDDYIRFCNDTGAIRTFLSVYSKTETDNKYRTKTDNVFNNVMIDIVTPAT